MKYNDNGEIKELNLKTLDTLPEGSIIEYEGTTVPSGWEEVQDYSTEEINTGKKWINGKPIYRAVVEFGNLPNNTEKRIDIDINNIEYIILMDGLVLNDAIASPFRQYISYIYVDKGQKKLGIGTSQDHSNLLADIILEYTKTTD